MSHQHCTNFLDIAQEQSQAKIDQKGKIVRNKIIKRIACFSRFELFSVKNKKRNFTLLFSQIFSILLFLMENLFLPSYIYLRKF